MVPAEPVWAAGEVRPAGAGELALVGGALPESDVRVVVRIWPVGPALATRVFKRGPVVDEASVAGPVPDVLVAVRAG